MHMTETISKRPAADITPQRPVAIQKKHVTRSDNAFAEHILADLIAQGYDGQTLLQKFKEMSCAIRPAVQNLIEEADAFAASGEGRISMTELFGKDE